MSNHCYSFEDRALVNSLRPSDAIWWHRSGSTLAQVMACCLTAPSHYLNQCWLIISSVQWLSSKDNPTRDTSAINRAANQYGTSVFCMDFTCKIREYEFGLQNTEIELSQFCHIKYCCQNKAYLFWVANQSRFVVFYALKPSNASLITKTFILLSSTCGSNTCSSSLPVPVVPKESTWVSTGSQWVPPE